MSWVATIQPFPGTNGLIFLIQQLDEAHFGPDMEAACGTFAHRTGDLRHAIRFTGGAGKGASIKTRWLSSNGSESVTTNFSGIRTPVSIADRASNAMLPRVTEQVIQPIFFDGR